MKQYSYITEWIDDINRSNIYLRDASEILYQKFSW